MSIPRVGGGARSTRFLFPVILSLMAASAAYPLRATPVNFIIDPAQTVGPGMLGGGFSFDATNPPGFYMGYDVLTLRVSFFGGDPVFSVILDIGNIGFFANGIDGADEGPSDSEMSLEMTFGTPLDAVTIGSSDTFDWDATFSGAVDLHAYPNQVVRGTGVAIATGAPEPRTAFSFLTGLLFLPCSLAFRKRKGGYRCNGSGGLKP